MVIAFTILCAACFGFAAQRGSLCVVSALATLIDGGSARVSLSFLRCVLWAALIGLPVAWVSPDGDWAPGYPISPACILGGLVFGLGAAINGGCSFGTLVRLASGDLSFLVTILGVVSGIVLHQHTLGIVDHPPAIALSVPYTHPVLAVLFLLLAIGHSLHQLANFSRNDFTGRWSPAAAVAIVGLSGGALFALSGPWNALLSIGDLFEAGSAARRNILPLTALSMVTLAGAFLAAVSNNTFSLKLAPARWPRRFLGGGLMGGGIALIPGGNAELILHSLPSLTPNSVPAYGALIIGSSATLLASRTLRRSAFLPARSIEVTASDIRNSR